MPLPATSPPMLRWFRLVVRRYFRRQFHGVRLSGREQSAGLEGPLMVYANHSSWWDPMVAFLLAEELFPTRRHYAPMDAAALARYRVLGYLGIFPVEMNSARGAVQFLRTGEAVLCAGGILWVTPQGRFADARERPLTFKPGLAALAARVAAKEGSCTVLPLAIEYPFWDERLPECLLRLGAPVSIVAGQRAEEIEPTLRTRLGEEMDALAGLALTRSAASFETLLAGSAGAGGLYAAGKRFKAALLGRRYIPEHSPSRETPQTAPSAPVNEDR